MIVVNDNFTGNFMCMIIIDDNFIGRNLVNDNFIGKIIVNKIYTGNVFDDDNQLVVYNQILNFKAKDTE